MTFCPPRTTRRIMLCTWPAETAGAAATGAPGAATVPLACTVMSNSATSEPSSRVAIRFVRPAFTPMMNRLVGEAGWTRAMRGSATSTVSAGPGSSTSRPAPCSSTSGRVSRGRIGVVIQELTKELADSFGLAKASGALVNSVE